MNDIIINNKNEIWKNIKGFENLYKVSNLGRVKSLNREVNYKNISTAMRKGKILTPRISKKGYLEVVLSKKHKMFYCRVHRLVAEAFIPNPLNLNTINHINEVKTDNRVSNLEWCTREENVEKYYENRTLVYQYDLEGNLIKCWKSITKAANFYNITKTGIQKCCIGKLKTYCNFIWTYTPVTNNELKIRNTNNTLVKVKLIKKDMTVITFNSMAEAAKFANCNPSFISMCCSGIRKSKLGIWKKENL